jgi:ferredoxin
MQTIETKMREAIKDLFIHGKVDVVIGFQKGSRPQSARPFFARSADDAGKMIWNDHCSSNVAVFLPKLFEKPQRPREGFKLPRVGVVTKGCDGRSIAGLVKEKQALRENLIIIGMPCGGMKPPSKHNGKKAADVGRACVECVNSTTSGADIVISGESKKPAKGDYARIKKFESLPANKRWERFVAEISKCIRCNACRQACPNCYCKVCFADQKKPSWAVPGAVLSDTIVFHIGRMFHQAGRCVECDACVNACPMGIDLRLFTQKLAMDAKELFGCVPGVTSEEVPPLQTFKQDDSECFITDPEEK